MDLQQFKDKHIGETVYVLANGPSLNAVDFDFLKGKFVIGTNKIFLKPEAAAVLTYYVACNPLVIEQSTHSISKMKCAKFLNCLVIDTWGGELNENAHRIDTSHREPSFRDPFIEPIWEGHTVTYVALQIAFAMGFETVIILGLDHHYEFDGAPNAEAKAYGKDPNHFDPGYFTDGAKWNLPDLKMSELAYALANQAFTDSGRYIFNASDQTKCNVFPLISFERHKKQEKTNRWTQPRVTAIVSAYKCADHLRGCMEDLISQTLWKQGDLEIVVLYQAGSPEAAILASFDAGFHITAQGQSQIVVWETDGIPTIYTAWNLGVQLSHGLYITNANADDRHREDSFELLANVLEGNPKLDLVYHDQFITWEPNQSYAEFVVKNGDKQLVQGRFEDEPGIFQWGEYSPERLQEGCFMGPQPMWRRDLHQRFGYFADEMKSAGDYDFWLRCAGQDNFQHIPVPMGLYLARLDGMELSDPQLSAKESEEAIMRNQNKPGLYFTRNREWTRISIAGRYVVADTAFIRERVKK